MYVASTRQCTTRNPASRSSCGVEKPQITSTSCKRAMKHVKQIYTVWPEILAGNLFWLIGGFESNPPIFHPPKLYSVLSSLFVIIASTCTIGLQLGAPV